MCLPRPGSRDGRLIASRAGVAPNRSSIARLDRMAGGAHRGSDNLDMRAAAAEIVAQRFQHLVLGRIWVARQQRLGGDDHAVETVAALRGLLADEGILHRIRMLARTEA